MSPSPPANNVSGSWTGVFSGLGAAEGNGQLSVTFDHRRVDADRSLLLGTWRLTSPDQTTIRSGTISGVGQGSAAQIELRPGSRRECNPPVLPFALLVDGFTLDVTMGTTQMSGTVTAYSCTAAIDASVELAR